ncbi:MAG: TetR/AcrR family transcriptional regulator [Rikenellaceae bacterium]|nr:TetR/AcrR family transcriptional regulator [Rikenellaceae bacterium]
MRGRHTREKILRDVYRLLLTDSYGRIAVGDIERATGLSRGTVFHHFHTKEHLFRCIVERYVLDTDGGERRAGLLARGATLAEFIRDARRVTDARYRLIRELGIDDPRLASLHIACQAACHYERYDEVMRLSRQAQLGVWTEAVRRACVSGELPAETDVGQTARILLLLSCGEPFEGMPGDRASDRDGRVGLCESYYALIRT